MITSIQMISTTLFPFYRLVYLCSMKVQKSNSYVMSTTVVMATEHWSATQSSLVGGNLSCSTVAMMKDISYFWRDSLNSKLQRRYPRIPDKFHTQL